MVKKYARKFELIKEMQLSEVLAKKTEKHHRNGPMPQRITSAQIQDPN
jgi:hypothetical protein